jgi:hypothetical protein
LGLAGSRGAGKAVEVDEGHGLGSSGRVSNLSSASALKRW